MKKILKIAGMVLGSLIVVILLLVAFISFSGQPTYEEVPILELSVASAPSDISHGRELFMQNCFDCHQNPGTGGVSGQFFGDSPLGSAYTANITHDPEYGAVYSDGELYRLLRTGVKQNQQLILPFMPKYALMSDEDLHDLIAFVQSDDPLFAPVQEERPVALSLLGKALMQFAWRPLAYSGSYRRIPPVADQVAYGEYLVNARLLCFGCHSASHEVNLSEPTLTAGYLGGGTEFGPGVVSPSLYRNDQGIGSWSQEDFVETMLTGITPTGDSMSSPMSEYPQLDTVELTAIWAYLGSVEPAEQAAVDE